MSSLASVATVVMTKFPEPGKVKTRLTPGVSVMDAARVHRVFLRHVVERLRRANPAELVLCHDPPAAGAAFRDLLGDLDGVTYLAQSDGDLGKRLADAARIVGEYHRRLLFLGVDSPDVPAEHLSSAAMLTGEVAVTLGPTDDGGFWCLGLWNEVDASALLDGIAWSSGKEARQTLERAGELGYAVARAGAWDDVDRPVDLDRLLRRLKDSTEDDDRALLRELSFLTATTSPHASGDRP